MKIVMFYPSLCESTFHATGSFISGVIRAFQSRGHNVQLVIPENPEKEIFNDLKNKITWYRKATDLKLSQILSKSDVVLVQDKNEPALIARIGKHRGKQTKPYALFFHDTSFNALKDTELLGKQVSLENYDAVLTGCDSLKEMYLEKGLARQAYTWQITVDNYVFFPQRHTAPEGDLVWIGNWGDEMRSSKLEEFLIKPVIELGLNALVYGTDYPLDAQNRLKEAGISYGGYLPYHLFPEVFAKHKVTVHIPDKRENALVNTKPSIRLFEALSCGIPLIASGWNEDETLFTPGKELLIAKSGNEMKMHLQAILNDSRKARDLASNGLRTINRHHSCSNRAAQLEEIVTKIWQSTSENLDQQYRTFAS